MNNPSSEPDNFNAPEAKYGPAGKLASLFINSKLTPLIILASIGLGLFAITKMPREEEPQIQVPLVDIMTRMPGASAKEVEQRVTVPVEHLVHDIPGVEYIYSTSQTGSSLVTARFLVGQSSDRAIVQIKQKLEEEEGSLPQGVLPPVVTLRSINDVPIVALTLHSRLYGPFELRSLALRVADKIKQINNVSQVQVTGGLQREVKVTLSKTRMAGFGLSPAAVANALQGANQRSDAGSFDSGNSQMLVRTGGFLQNAREVGNVVVGVSGNNPITLKDVADVQEGPGEAADYVLFGYGPGAHQKESALENAVTLSVAKQPGVNAVALSETIQQMVDSLKGNLLPDEVTVTVTRDYGHTANEKSNDLLFHMALAVLSVTLLIAFTLGRRESLVVAVAIPVTLALTLLVFTLAGYTLNRITLFALVFSIGILADDAIVVVENIVRHYRMPDHTHRNALTAAIAAVDEVGNPTLLATFAVIAAILPMAFVGGLMGPYMRPIPIGASAAMLFSVFIAFTVTPWAAYRLLKRERKEGAQEAAHSEGHDDWMTRLYRKVMTPLLDSGKVRFGFFALVALLMLGAVALLPLKAVVVKMLPFDNKDEFQLIVDMPNGTTLEQTAAATRALADFIATVPEVKDYQIYAGTHSPYNFNGLVRQYYLRDRAYQADIQVNLVGKSERSSQSHAIVKRIRPELARIAKQWGIRLKVAEIPPGPPVLETLVAEIYGPTAADRLMVARQVKTIFEKNPGVTDTDWYVDDPQTTYHLAADRKKAALDGVSVTDINTALAAALGGEDVGLAHDPEAREAVPIRLQLARVSRSGIAALQGLYVRSQTGAMIPLSELTVSEKVPYDESIYHKNLLPVVYVTGDVTGRLESPVYSILSMDRAVPHIQLPPGQRLNVLSSRLPYSTDHITLKWDGEWQITYEVFRDLGIAFAVVLALIYILVVGWFQSFKTPLIIMAPIPLTLVGILPAHALLGGFFTATSMIGFIAGGGIIVRNSIILVDFIEVRLKQGVPLAEAVIDAGAVRFRPMLLTAAAVIAGSYVLLSDPIFQGLAIALMAGEIASTLLSRLAVPVLYYMVHKGDHERESAAPSGSEAESIPSDHIPL